MKNIKCWWFGCSPDLEKISCHQDWEHDHEYTNCHVPCSRCGAHDTSYEDQVGLTRHARVKDWCHYWLVRTWWPAKCTECGHRFKCDDSIDHLPF